MHTVKKNRRDSDGLGSGQRLWVSDRQAAKKDASPSCPQADYQICAYIKQGQGPGAVLEIANGLIAESGKGSESAQKSHNHRKANELGEGLMYVGQMHEKSNKQAPQNIDDKRAIGKLAAPKAEGEFTQPVATYASQCPSKGQEKKFRHSCPPVELVYRFLADFYLNSFRIPETTRSWKTVETSVSFSAGNSWAVELIATWTGSEDPKVFKSTNCGSVKVWTKTSVSFL